jgi:phospholipase A-2-activating protein
MAPVEQLASIPGKKEGEVKMFRNGNKPEVYAWDGTTWQKLGDVVGGSTKKQFAGDKYFPAGEYDYVFDVDDDSGVPKLIPLNDGDNQLDVAERFCKREGYSKSYLGQVMTFLKKVTSYSHPRTPNRKSKKNPLLPLKCKPASSASPTRCQFSTSRSTCRACRKSS